MAIRQGRYTLNLTTRPSILGNAEKPREKGRFPRNSTTFIRMTRSAKFRSKKRKALYSAKRLSVRSTRRAKRLRTQTIFLRAIY